MIVGALRLMRPAACTTLRMSFEQVRFSTEAKCWSVSSHGRCRTTSGRVTLGSLEPSGYCKAVVSGQQFLVHRLVAHAFLGPPPSMEAWQVHHRDGNPSNNRVDNLEYVTPSRNTQLSFKTSPSRDKSLRSKPVLWRPTGSELWRFFPSIASAAKHLGVACSTVSKCCNHGSQFSGGEVKFAEPLEPPLIHGEKWVPMLDPATGLEVSARKVSSYGRLTSSRGLIYYGHEDRNGYFSTRFNATSFCYVHRLVAFAFLGAPPSPEHTHINHKDFDRGNNNVENLEYATPAENMRHSWSVPGRRRTSKEILSKPVCGRQYGTENRWRWYPSLRSAALALGVNSGSVSACTRGSLRQTGGYEFTLVATNYVLDDLPGEEWRKVDLQGLLEERRRRQLK